MILKSGGGVSEEEPLPLETQLQRILPGIDNLSAIIDYLERIEIAPGEMIIKQGEKADTLFFIESGRVTTQLDQPDGPPIRLESMGNTGIVGEVGFYLGKNRTASVIADKKSVVYQISNRGLKEIEKKDPETASIFHRVIAHLMAERFTSLITTVGALQK